MKYTCQPTENSLDELGIPKNPYFDPSHDSVASFSRFLEGGHSMPPPIRTAIICIPSVKGLRHKYTFHSVYYYRNLTNRRRRMLKAKKQEKLSDLDGSKEFTYEKTSK